MFKKFMKFAIPSIIAMLITSLYLVVDGIFIAWGVGEIGVAAVTLVFPITTGFTAISMIFAVGGSNLVSLYFGGNDIKKANNIFRQSIYILTIIGVIITFLGVVLSDEIVRLLGATSDLRSPAKEYYTYYMLFCIPVLFSTTLSTFIRNDNSPRLSMYAMICGALANIVLDYVFVFPLNMGLKGAAIATGLGQLLSVIICLLHFKKKTAKLSFGKVKFSYYNIRDIVSIGLASFLVDISYSIIMYFYNKVIISKIGPAAVTSYGIVNYITNLSYMMLLGVSQAVQPLISYEYGGKRFGNSIKYCKLGLIFSFIFSTVLFALYIPLGKAAISIFTRDSDVSNLAYTILTYTDLAYIPLGLNMIIITFFQSVCMPWKSNLLCFMRGLILIKLFITLLPGIFGSIGIWTAMFASEMGTLIIGSILLMRAKKNLKLEIHT
ncbi:putative efflux protein, MATE family [Hathewaya proteolytica DSM 3090]|uniref:Multidrug export protein MepA n=1 Tax=Hathewaya proteolytica DSM 3090 TaxID=1121331 RepID=A0A1M6JLQ1_9CLOT|nr:MATE family efflux transporter [Hathewaya proteolytica]SHJ47606.1 putative efflux protein, MATE family [Hathewaya proteolytica DSM 3090]